MTANGVAVFAAKNGDLFVAAPSLSGTRAVQIIRAPLRGAIVFDCGTPGVATLNPGLSSCQPCRAALTHADRRAWKLARGERAERVTPGFRSDQEAHPSRGARSATEIAPGFQPILHS